MVLYPRDLTVVEIVQSLIDSSRVSRICGRGVVKDAIGGVSRGVPRGTIAVPVTMRQLVSMVSPVSVDRHPPKTRSTVTV